MIFLNMHRFESYSNETANTALEGRFILNMVSFCLLNTNIFLEVS